MFDFCPHCGQTIERTQVRDGVQVCETCAQGIGVAAETMPAPVVATPGGAARCPRCSQVVAVKGNSLVPHYASAAKRTICPGSGKAM